MNTLHTQPNSWLTPQLESVSLPEKGGHGIYATELIQKGTLLALFGGTIIDAEQLARISDSLRSLSIQVAENLFLVSVVPGAGDYFNHSCEPNAGMVGQIGLVAMRDIAAGEEITFDYAMCDSHPYDEFACACGSSHCRGQVTGNDWQIPQLWTAYRGYFSSYLQQKIDILRTQSNGKFHHPE